QLADAVDQQTRHVTLPPRPWRPGGRPPGPSGYRYPPAPAAKRTVLRQPYRRGRKRDVPSATDLRRAVARTPLAPLAAFPKRFLRVARHDAQVIGTSLRWLFTSREHHNYTYDLTPLNREHLAWFVSLLCDVPVSRVRYWFDEIEGDDALRTRIETATAASDRRGLADKQVRYGRRIGWY